MSDPRHSVGHMIIDCDKCEVRGGACSDCVVSFLTIPVRPSAVQPKPTEAIVDPVQMDSDQLKAVANLAAGGLVAPLRLVERRRAG